VSKQNDFSVAKAAPGAATRMLAARVLAQVFTRGRSLKSRTGLGTASWPTVVIGPAGSAVLCSPAPPQYLRRCLAVVDAEALSARDADLRTLLMVGFAQLDVLELPAHAACRRSTRPRAGP
jgi:16S rRNA (cytosine967-C5)-methyltransferase